MVSDGDFDGAMARWRDGAMVPAMQFDADVVLLGVGARRVTCDFVTS